MPYTDKNTIADHKFLQGDGEMGGLIRTYNWSATPLGPPSSWPPALKIAAGIMITNPFPMYIAWGNEYVQLYNDAYRPILGSTKHPQALGISTRETFAEIWHIIGPMFEGVMAGKAVGFPNFMLPLERNGFVEECYFDFSYSPICDEDGNVGGVLVTVVETTEQVKALNSLKETKNDLQKANAETKRQRDRLKNFFMQAPAGICILNGPQLVFELINPSYQQLFPGRSLLGKALLEAIPEIRSQPIWDILQGVYNTNKTFEGSALHIPLAREDEGKIEDRFFNFIYQPRHNAGGQVDGILVFVFEVTDMITARRELERERYNSKLAAIAAELGTFDMDLIKGTMDWDERCRALFGISHSETVTYEKDFLPGLHPDDRDRVIHIINNVFIKAVSGGDYDVEYRTIGVEDQQLRWLRAKGKTYFDDTDRPTRFVGSVLDITEQKLNEIRKNDFIAMVSHELKTPLTSLKAYTQLMSARAGKSQESFTVNALDKINRQVNKMTAMINGFLNVAQLESGKIPLSKTTFCLNDLVDETVEEILITTQSHDIVCLPCAPQMINADHNKIGQVINNLLSNAIKYSPKGKRIEISCKQKDGKVIVSVKDEGIGIKPNDAEKLFDRFYRVDNKHTQTISGFGIGLYLSSELVTQHGGSIWVESEIGKGSTFFFSLPLMQPGKGGIK